jgi:hypothetical protein
MPTIRLGTKVGGTTSSRPMGVFLLIEIVRRHHSRADAVLTDPLNRGDNYSIRT